MILHIIEAWLILSVPFSLLAGRFCSMNNYEADEQAPQQYTYAEAA